jgi:hypothetical protein
MSTILNLAYDLNRGWSSDPAARVSREDIIEYIHAFSVDRQPDHPTTAVAWDLQRTFGERDGRRLLLCASRRWDKQPLTPRQVVGLRWWENYEPRAWVDEYLTDVICSWRTEQARLQLCADAEKEWLAFGGFATPQQLDKWREKFGGWYLAPEEKLGPVKIIKPVAPGTPMVVPLQPSKPLVDFSGNIIARSRCRLLARLGPPAMSAFAPLLGADIKRASIAASPFVNES